MVLNDNFLDDVADSITGFISHFGITESVFTPDPTDTTLPGELAGRVTTSTSKSGVEITFTGTRSSAVVLDTTNGDDWKGIGWFNASTSGDLEAAISTTGILQTTNFDVEVQLKVTPRRT